MNSPPRTYFLSTGRCGTKYLSIFFSKFYPEYEIMHQARWSRIINILTNSSFVMKKQGYYYNKIFILFKKFLTPTNTLDPLLSVALYLSLRDTKIKTTNIIHLVRDPRDFVTSFMNWKSSSKKKLILHYIIPFWQPFPQGNGVTFLQWIFMSKFEKYCWVWYYKNSLFKELAKSSSYQLIKIEDLTNSRNRSQNMLNLIMYLKLEKKDIDYYNFSANPVNKSDREKFPNYKKWTLKQKTLLQEICGSLMNEFGYCS